MKSLARALLLGAFCFVASESMAAPERPGTELRTSQPIDRSAAARNGESAVVTALLDAMDEALGAGRPEEALALLERALRIEPRNAALWHYLGIANLESGHYAQAEAMAAKSQSLAGGNRTLRTRNEGLTAAALRAQGKPLPVNRESASLAARRRPNPQLEPAVTYVDTRSRYERENRPEQRRASRSAERAPRPGGGRLSELEYRALRTSNRATLVPALPIEPLPALTAALANGGRWGTLPSSTVGRRP